MLSDVHSPDLGLDCSFGRCNGTIEILDLFNTPKFLLSVSRMTTAIAGNIAKLVVLRIRDFASVF